MDVDGWLDLVADVLAGQPAGLPEERIARQLVVTFDAAGCAFHEGHDGAPPVRRSYPPEPVPEERQGDRVDGEMHRVVLPLPAGPDGQRTFVVGRPAAFTPAEVALAARLEQLLAGLDRRTAAPGRGPARTVPAPADVRLTPRERDVLALVADGRTAAAVARRLEVAERTVHKHLERVYAKLRVGDRVSAVVAAQRLGLLDRRAG